MPTPTAASLFEEELHRRSVPFRRDKATGLYHLRSRGISLEVSLGNIEQTFSRDQDPAAVVHFAEVVLTSGLKLRTWEQARACLYLSLEGVDLEAPGAIETPLTRSVKSVLVESDPQFSNVAFVTKSDLSTWGIDAEQAHAAARDNLNRLLVGITLETGQAAGKTLGMIPLESPFKASVVLAPAFKYFVSPTMGWPVLVVAPCRDFIYVIKQEDEALLGSLGAVVLREYQASGYPITAEVLEVSDNGIEGIGSFLKPPGE